MFLLPDTLSDVEYGVFSIDDCVLYYEMNIDYIHKYDPLGLNAYLCMMSLEWRVDNKKSDHPSCYCCNNSDIMRIYKTVDRVRVELCYDCCRIMDNIVNEIKSRNLKWWTLDGDLFIKASRWERWDVYDLIFPFTVVPIVNFLFDKENILPNGNCYACNYNDGPIYGYGTVQICPRCYTYMKICIQQCTQKIMMLREMMNDMPIDIQRVIIKIIIATFNVPMIKGKIYRGNENINIPEELLI